MLPIQQMAQSHPRPLAPETIANLAACIESCFLCVATCTACANACTYEDHVQDLRLCIRLNMDCADICNATGRILARHADYDLDLLTNQLQTCITACNVCGRECNKHTEMHEHCRVCADVCRQCAEACEQVLMAVPL